MSKLLATTNARRAAALIFVAAAIGLATTQELQKTSKLLSIRALQPLPKGPAATHRNLNVFLTRAERGLLFKAIGFKVIPEEIETPAVLTLRNNYISGRAVLAAQGTTWDTFNNHMAIKGGTGFYVYWRTSMPNVTALVTLKGDGHGGGSLKVWRKVDTLSTNMGETRIPSGENALIPIAVVCEQPNWYGLWLNIPEGGESRFDFEAAEVVLVKQG